MSNYTAGLLNAAQAKIRPQYNAAELRERQNPILRVGLANQNYLMANVEDIKKSDKRSVKGYQFKKTSATNGTARSHNFTGAQGDSAEVDLSWSTLSETFGLYMNTGSDNVMSTAEMLANEVKQAMRIIRERMGSGLVTALHAGRTATSNATVRNATFNAATNAFEVDGNTDQFFAYVRSVMNQHKYLGGVDVLVDSILDPIARKIAAQGSANGTNLSYQLQGLNIMPHDILGTDVAVSAYTDGGIAIALPEYSFSYIPWIPLDYRQGKGIDILDSNGIYTTMMDDTGLPIQYALRGYTEKADGSSAGSTVDALLTHWQLSVDVATQISEISAASETPVYEFAYKP